MKKTLFIVLMVALCANAHAAYVKVSSEFYADETGKGRYFSNASGTLISNQVQTIAALLNAETARVTVTNFNSTTELAEMDVAVKVVEEGTPKWIEVWHEMTRWNAFTGTNGFNWGSWGGFYTFQTNLQAILDWKADRPWGSYDSSTGDYAPQNFTQISSSNVLICAGAGYQKVIGTSGYWVLTAHGVGLQGGQGDHYRIKDSSGATQFEIVQGSRFTLSAKANSLVWTADEHVQCEYAITNAISSPVAMFTRDLANPDWKASTDPACLCNATWTNLGGNMWRLEWWPKSTESQMFCEAVYSSGTDSRIKHHVATELTQIIIGPKTYTIGTAEISGNTVLTLTEVTP